MVLLIAYVWTNLAAEYLPIKEI